MTKEDKYSVSDFAQLSALAKRIQAELVLKDKELKELLSNTNKEIKNNKELPTKDS